MRTYEVTVSPRIEEGIHQSREFEKHVLDCLCQFLQNDWGSVSPYMQESNDEIAQTDSAIPSRLSILGINRPPVYDIFACYPKSKWGVLWIIRDMRFQKDDVGQLVILRPMEYGKWNGPYSPFLFSEEAV